MSKIAEKRVKELGYFKDPLNRAEYTANDLFNACVECYDQAMQDFLEKACDYLQKNIWRINTEEYEFLQRFVTDFKNYMQNESEGGMI
jgi:hypothetical protein